jgi:thiol:disulfide interchange protein DsbD
MYRLITSLCFAMIFPLTAQAQEEFLKPDQAFTISAGKSDAGKALIKWNIADGYYLYQSKFRFHTDNKEVFLQSPDLPQAITKKDPFFGEIEVYRGQLEISVPLQTSDEPPEILEIDVRSQGCADAGICYPPHTQTVLVALDQMADQPRPVAAEAIAEMQASLDQVDGSGDSSSAPEEDPLVALSALNEDLGLDEEDDILTPDQAFQFFAEAEDGQQLKLRWNIADGTYLYHDKVTIDLASDGVSLGKFEFPEPKIKHDSVKPDGTIGDVAVYFHAIDLSVPLIRNNTNATEISVSSKYQGCADIGICYPPANKTVKLQLPAIAAATAETAAPATAAPATAAATRQAAPQAGATRATETSEQDQITNLLKGSSSWLIVASFFGIGLLLAFTPCVFPMIPILSGIIAGQGKQITTRKAFTLSLIYVLAMAVTYTIAGVMAGLFGSNIQAAFQNPWILSAFAAVFVLLALSMFGFYELQLPASWQSKLSDMSNRQQGGSLVGVAIMGLLSALIVGPCVAPPLAGALIFIGQTGDWMLGGLALFAMSMGMGAPLIAIGTSAGKILPRAGAWMDTVKAVFGVVMLGLAISMLERFIPAYATMLLWGTLLVVSAIYMGAVRQLPVEASGWSKLWKGLGMVLLIYGVLFLVGVAAGGKDATQPLRGILVNGGGSSTSHVTFKPIKSTDDLERELAAAAAAGKPVMLDFYADWCVYCKQMEKNTFPEPEVASILANFVLLQADVTAQDETDLALQKQIGIPAPPAMIFWNSAGEEFRHLRLMGYMNAADFAKHAGKANQ